MSKNNTSVNPTNKCSHLFDQNVSKLDKPLVEIFEMQRSLQKKLGETGRGINYDTATFQEKVQDLNNQWKNLTLEFAELLERLPHKNWKTYTEEQKNGTMSREDRLEILYEYSDMFHFFINIGLLIGVDGELLEKLYVTKNAENFNRQKRGY